MSELYDRYPSAASFFYEDGRSLSIYLICLSMYRCCFYILSDPVESQGATARGIPERKCVSDSIRLFPFLFLWSIWWSIVDVCVFFFTFSYFIVTFSSPLLVTIQSHGKNRWSNNHLQQKQTTTKVMERTWLAWITSCRSRYSSRQTYVQLLARPFDIAAAVHSRRKVRG
jgi:hypothetical protein